MNLAISDVLDGALAQLVFTVIAVLGTVNVWYLARIKKTTGQTNIAVNHRDEDEPTISKQVGQSATDIVDLKYDMHHIKGDVGELKVGQKNIQGAIENLLQSHVITKSKLDEVLNTMPKRKTD